jgi:hypothetical protein
MPETVTRPLDFVGRFEEHRRAVEALSITPPGGATYSIRCAISTCSPTAV